MDIKSIVAELDTEIAHLQKIRAALLGVDVPVAKQKAGRPKGSVATKAAAPVKKRKLSPEGRKRIVDAMKRRWAAQKKQSGK